MPIVKKTPEEYQCPLTTDLMKDPVIALDGRIYDRHAIENWLNKNPTSPFTRLPLEKKFIPIPALQEEIARLRNSHNKLCTENTFIDAVKAGDLTTLKQLYYSEEYLIDNLDAILAQPKTDVLELFIKDGFSLETKVKDKKTLLHLAADVGNAEAIKVLLEAEPSLLEQKDDNGLTALHCAAMNGDKCFDACKALIDAGADIDAKTSKNITLTGLIPQQSSSKTLELFLKATEHKKKAEEIAFNKNILKGFFKKKKQEENPTEAIKAGLKLTMALRRYLSESDLADSHYHLGKIYLEFARDGRQRFNSIMQTPPQLILNNASIKNIDKEMALVDTQIDSAIINLQSALKLYKSMKQTNNVTKLVEQTRAAVDEVMAILFEIRCGKVVSLSQTKNIKTGIHKAVALNNFYYLTDVHEQYPNCIANIKYDTYHPLITALKDRRNNPEMITFLIKNTPANIFKSYTPEGNHPFPPLYHALFDVQDEIQQKKLMANFLGNSNDFMHWQLKTQITVVEKLIEKDPQQLVWHHPTTGVSLLTMALTEKIDSSLFELLISKAPADPFKTKDLLIQAIRYPVSTQIIELIIRKNPNDKHTYYNQTPLDIALANSASLDTLKHICSIFPDNIPPASLAFSQQQLTGKNPLENALTSKNFQFAEYLIDQHPHLLYLKDQDGKLLLQLINPINIPNVLSDKIIKISTEIQKTSKINISIVNKYANQPNSTLFFGEKKEPAEEKPKELEAITHTTPKPT